VAVTDALTAVLENVRIDGGLYGRAELRAPWGIRFPAADTLTFHMVDAGGCWLRSPAADGPLKLDTGDVVVLPHGDAHTLGDRPGRGTGKVYDITDVQHRVPCPVFRNAATGAPTTLVCGAVRFRRTGEWLLGLLPPVLHVPAGTAEAGRLRPVLALLADETAQSRPGGEAMVSRLCDVIVIEVLRVWIDTAPGHAGWLAGLRDPRIAAALGQLHAAPDRAWTVVSLAQAAGMSRSRFALRFAELVGATPVRYLTEWRLYRAAELLADPVHSLRTVAQHSGYASEAAFSKAFKRRFGVSPDAYRRNRDR
jgi:AraC-like DNA-binding protein